MKTSLVLVMMLAAPAMPAPADQASAHHDMVMSHGAQVMPFDQKVAMHMFTPNASGGTLEVMVHNMDIKQVALVRRHLRQEAALFATGDYSDPHISMAQQCRGYEGWRPILWPCATRLPRWAPESHLFPPTERQSHQSINGSPRSPLIMGRSANSVT